ncbi:MAG: Holliday junction branch migration DNA helicase RuvB [Patescibacteria group bacterium]
MSRPSPRTPKTPPFSSSDTSLDAALRPNVWEEYIGQPHIKENLRILLAAAKERGQSPEHVLLYGPAGLGKTTLAHLIATELGGTMKVTSGPAIEKVGDLAALLTNLSPGDILFIDEVHRLNRAIEEVLYPAMESGRLDIIIGKGPSARTVQLELPPFTLVAATTRVAMLSSPLRSRFSGGTFRLAFYTEDEILDIVRRSAHLLGIEASEDAFREIARRSRFTPRTANHLLKRARDFAQVTKEPLSLDVALKAFDLLGVDHVGLTTADRKLLSVLIENFNGGPAGLSTLSASLSEDIATIEEVLEPYLMQLGFLERTPRGRAITEKGKLHVRGKNQGTLL